MSVNRAIHRPNPIFVRPAHGISRAAASIFALLLLVIASGCRTPVSLPPVNLQQPGWTVHTGQAVWHRKGGGEGVAGELLVATRRDGRAFVQFSKDPFPLVVAQRTRQAWTAEFPPQNKHYSGHGRPPQQIIFLQLPRVLAGHPPRKGWSWTKLKNGGQRLKNLSSGEFLDVYLSS